MSPPLSSFLRVFSSRLLYYDFQHNLNHILRWLNPSTTLWVRNRPPATGWMRFSPIWTATGSCILGFSTNMGLRIFHINEYGCSIIAMSYFPMKPTSWTFPIIELRQFDSGRNLRGTVFSKGLPNHEKIRRFEKDHKLDGNFFCQPFQNYTFSVPLSTVLSISY